ncbi:hypothetical protein ACFQL1_08710 [Halomicroarcula sp. GCM10025709]|uniref:hypothetical protein n=1 Tax=Haloarcula TaxID=2237 RepID=UPI0024C42BA0|nr:hypothetical protein [Halomicroarcula sp. YJ-61-S]
MDAVAALLPVLTALLAPLVVRFRDPADPGDEGTTGATALRRQRRAAAALGWGSGAAVALWLDVPAGIEAGLVGPVPWLGRPAVAVAGTALALVVPLVPALVGARLATLSVQRRVGRLPLTYRAALRFELERGVAGFGWPSRPSRSWRCSPAAGSASGRPSSPAASRPSPRRPGWRSRSGRDDRPRQNAGPSRRRSPRASAC